MQTNMVNTDYDYILKTIQELENVRLILSVRFFISI